MQKARMSAVLVAVIGLSASAALADVDAAKGYLKEATDLIEKKDLDAAGMKLELAETELDGVAAGAKVPLEASIKAARQKIAEVNAAANKPKYQRQLRGVMDDAEGAIGNLVIWGGIENKFNDLLKNDEAKAALGADLEAAAKKFSTFKKLHMKKASAQIAEQLESTVKDLETAWAEAKAKIADPETSPNSKNSAIEGSERDIARARKRLAALPEDDERAKAFAGRIDKVAAEFTKIALADRVKEVTENLQRGLELYKSDFDGYEKEVEGPTWAAYTKQTSEKMSKFFAPKTIEFYERMDGFLENLASNEDYQSVKADASIKAIVDGVIARREAAYAKLVKLVAPVVDAAEKAEIKPDASNWERLSSDIRVALGEKSPDAVALKGRIDKKLKDHEAATTGKDAARAELITRLSEKANEAWPKLKEGLKPANGEGERIDVAKFKGKTVAFSADNLSGYRFKPSDFYYTTTLGGTPVAAQIDPLLMNQIKAIEKTIGRSLGDDDNDGKWEVIAVITGDKTKLMAKRQSESSGTVEGLDVKVKTEYAEPVEAVIIEVIAAKCGPFAGAKGKGVLKEDGTIGK